MGTFYRRFQPYIILIILFIIYICLTFYYQTTYLPNNIDQNQTLNILLQNESFYYSLLASSYEDIVFFALIGLAAFIYSFKRPEDEKLENRINTLFTNHDAVDASVLTETKNSLKRLAVYSPETTLTLTILEKKEYRNSTLLKIGIDRKIYLQSLIHDLDNFETTGQVEFYGETACPLPDQTYGEIHEISLMYTVDNIIHCVRNYTMKEEYYKHEFKELFKKDNKLMLYSNLWMWMLNGDVYEYRAYRTTSKVSISVKNNLEESIIATPKDREEKEIHSGEVVCVVDKAFMAHNELAIINLKIKE